MKSKVTALGLVALASVTVSTAGCGSADPDSDTGGQAANTDRRLEAVERVAKQGYQKHIDSSGASTPNPSGSIVELNGVACEELGQDSYRCVFDATIVGSGRNVAAPVPYRLEFRGSCYEARFDGPDRSFDELTRFSGCFEDSDVGIPDSSTSGNSERGGPKLPEDPIGEGAETVSCDDVADARSGLLATDIESTIVRCDDVTAAITAWFDSAVPSSSSQTPDLPILYYEDCASYDESYAAVTLFCSYYNGPGEQGSAPEATLNLRVVLPEE